MQAVHKRSFKFRSFAALASLVALGASTGSAEARSQSPILGNSKIGAEATCFNFTFSDGRVTQRGGAAPCNGRLIWVMPIVYDNAGGHSISVAAHSLPNTEVSCKSRSVDRWGAGVLVGPKKSTSGGASQLLTSPVNAYGFGSTWITCDMDPGTSLTSVHY